MRTIDEILTFIKQFHVVEKDVAVANLLGVRQSMVSMWKQRGTIPYETLFRYCRVHGVNFTYLLTGEEAQKPSIHGIIGVDTERERDYVEKLLIIMREKSPSTQRAIMNNIDEFLRVPAEGNVHAGQRPAKKKAS